jgi:hypothetical protein
MERLTVLHFGGSNPFSSPRPGPVTGVAASVRRPDLFIVGAPKCGTSALHQYLGDHPRIFMSRKKEPWFFADDLPRFVTTLEEYTALFSDATDRHLAVGESSASYLRSNAALHRIRDFSPDARIVVMVRDPVGLVHSYHSQQLLILNEDETDFERAWRLQEDRRRGEHIPRSCRSPRFLLYAEVARLGEQVERLLEIFERRRVKLIVFDDFVSDTRLVYEDVLEFLDVPSDDRRDFPRVNPSQVARSRLLARLGRRPPQVLLRPYLRLKKRRGWGDLGLTVWLNRVNAREVERPPLKTSFRLELIEEFRDDVDRLARLLDRDLSHWQTVPDDHHP